MKSCRETGPAVLIPMGDLRDSILLRLCMVDARGPSTAFLCIDVRPGLFKAKLDADHTR